jgi:DNA-binding GntR family transcriptional regulator
MVMLYYNNTIPPGGDAIVGEDFSIGEVKELSTVVADRLAEMIQSGILKPRDRLVQNDLAEQFGVSRVAVRDALHKLMQRKLAVKIPRKGIIVRPVSCKMIRDIIAVRRVLETTAAKLACSNMAQDDLEHLNGMIQEQESLTQKGEVAQLIKKDWEFHIYIYDRCDNQVLKDIIADLWCRMRQAQGLVQADVEWGTEWVKHSAAFHQQLLEALRKQDIIRLEQLLTSSLDSAEKGLIQAFQELRCVDVNFDRDSKANPKL